MAKEAASDVWKTAIKYSGMGGYDFIARCSLPSAVVYVGFGMILAAVNGELMLSTAPGAAEIHDYGLSVAEELAADDRYFLCHKDGGKILHNQKLAGTYKIGDAVYQSSSGTWTYTKSDVEGKLYRIGFVVGPVDRITDDAVKGIDDTLSVTEPVDILI